ncbi:hypothetical protein LJC47_07505, partial [Desulfosarcina sp. OttesenSCG-928-B08]|nr:hypothetical protein [Desulfosarcina sp. OttesenSCG-928-B08]
PVITNVPADDKDIFVEQPADLPGFTVSDADEDRLTVTLTAIGGTLGGVTDADGDPTNGIQLKGSAADINTALADLTFTATQAGNAAITIFVSDGRGGTARATYPLFCNDLLSVSYIENSEDIQIIGNITADTTFTVDPYGNISVTVDRRERFFDLITLDSDQKLDLSKVTATGGATVTINTIKFSTPSEIIAPKDISNTMFPGSATLVTGGDKGDTITVEDNVTVTTINGGAGNDIITVEKGGTVGSKIVGEVGTISGGAGNDTITVKDGGKVDYIYGEAGNDIITVQTGGTVTGDIISGEGVNQITVAGTVTGNIGGGEGKDEVTVEKGGTVDGTISGGDGADTIKLNNQTATIKITSGDTGDYTKPGAGASFDLVGIDLIYNPGTGTTFDLGGGWGADTSPTASNNFVNTVADNEIYVIRGTVEDGKFTATADGKDALLVYDANSASTDPMGLEGNNISPQAVALVGMWKNSDPHFSYDFITTAGGVKIRKNIAGAQDQQNNITVADGERLYAVTGGTDVDTITVKDTGSRVDTISGGAGDDIITVEDGGKVITINGDAGADNITVDGSGSEVDAINGGAGADKIYVQNGGTVGVNINGGDDNDTITITGGTVGGNINGDGGNDTITITGGTVGGTINGGDDDDSITITGGTVGTINGEAGNDTITITGGTVGTINGGEGADTFNLGAYTVKAMNVTSVTDLINNALKVGDFGDTDTLILDGITSLTKGNVSSNLEAAVKAFLVGNETMGQATYWTDGGNTWVAVNGSTGEGLGDKDLLVCLMGVPHDLDWVPAEGSIIIAP